MFCLLNHSAILSARIFYKHQAVLCLPLQNAFNTRTISTKKSNPFITVPEDQISIDINRYKAVGGIFSHTSLVLGNALPNDITSRVRVSFNVKSAEWMPEYGF